jgi:hypothetical protein
MVRSASRSSFLFEHDLFGKPDSTYRLKARGQAFPDHALKRATREHTKRISGGDRTSLSRTGIWYQIARKVGIKRVHRLLIGGVNTKADEAIRPHKDRPAVGDAGDGGTERRG